MAAITPETLRATIRFRGDYQNLRKFPDADVDAAMQAAFGEFYELVDEVHEGYWDTDATVTTTAGTGYVALPARTWRVHGVDRYDGTEPVPLTKVSRTHRNRHGSNTGKPTTYWLSSRGINLAPAPDAAYTLRVLYTPIAPVLSASQPREWYNGWEEYVIASTLLKLDEREKMPIGERVAMLEKLEKRIRSGASGRGEQEPEYLNLREGVSPVDPYDEGVY
jgi:hypothetical protein